MNREWTADDVLALSRTYQGACVLAAAADLDLFGAIARGGSTELPSLARDLGCDARGLAVLLDALCAIGLLSKGGVRWSVPDGARALLTSDAPGSVLPMVRHQANCMRRWVQLATVVKTGRPAERTPSIRGEEEDTASFIGGMHVLSRPVAADLIGALLAGAGKGAGLSAGKDAAQRAGRSGYRHFLDVGGGPGTWTLAFLEASPGAMATLFDLPGVIPLAERNVAGAGMGGRVRLVAGDYMKDPLPGGADLAWVSAIVHSLSRAESRRLYGSVRGALEPGGTIAVRDVVMAPDRTSPPMGALFAVNMLVGTEGGGTYTFEELREDLEAAGFVDAALLRRDEGMHSIVTARKPA